MSRPNCNDISIGQDRWIAFIDIDGKQGDAVDLDMMIEPIWPFLHRLETHCVADCCGIDAFAFWPEEILGAANEIADAGLRERIVAVRNRVAESAGDVFLSRKMNHYFHRRVLLELLDHVVSCLPVR